MTSSISHKPAAQKRHTTIHYYATCWNEEYILPHFLAHHRQLKAHAATTASHWGDPIQYRMTPQFDDRPGAKAERQIILLGRNFRTPFEKTPDRDAIAAAVNAIRAVYDRAPGVATGG